MSALSDYVKNHVERGACTCGRCVDAPENPQDKQPTGHTVDMVFFKVKAVNDPSADELRRLIGEHTGVFNQVNPLDGKDHSYIEIGGWIGDQGLALMLMGLGKLVGLWELLTPRSVLGDIPDELVEQMAGYGLISVQAVAVEGVDG